MSIFEKKSVHYFMASLLLKYYLQANTQIKYKALLHAIPTPFSLIQRIDIALASLNPGEQAAAKESFSYNIATGEEDVTSHKNEFKRGNEAKIGLIY